MKLTEIGKEYVVLNEENIKDCNILEIPKIHLIKLAFDVPTKEKIEATLQLFPKTNRFIIDREIKTYNDVLKYSTKKFYVENRYGASVISFFRKNNKVLVNFNKLRMPERLFLLSANVLPDLLFNVEVVQMNRSDFEDVKNYLDVWSGNVILEG